jgi:hypothetical protein
MTPRSRRLRLRRPDRCAVCEAPLSVGALAFWSAEAKTVTCIDCFEAGGLPARPSSVVEGQVHERVLDRGVLGASAKRPYERLHARRERQARDRYGRLGGIYLALTGDPQSTTAWAQGSRGEQKLGQYLEGIQDESAVVILHDRRIPGLSRYRGGRPRFGPPSRKDIRLSLLLPRRVESPTSLRAT